MNRNLLKSTFREIRKSFGRFLSITCIIALGVGFFSGLKITRPDMIQTADQYLSEHAFFDYRLINTLGFDEQSVADAQSNPLIEAAEGSRCADLLLQNQKDDDVYKIHSIPQKINTLHLVSGRLPEKENECIADRRYFSEETIGEILTVSPQNNEDGQKLLKEKNLTIVGIADSPLYLNYERGTTSLGNGAVKAFLYVLPEAFSENYFTELYLTLADPGQSYSDAYRQAVEETEDAVTELSAQLAAARFSEIKAQAEQTYAENEDLFREQEEAFRQEKENAEQKLSQAETDLQAEKKNWNEKQQEYQTGKETYLAAVQTVNKAKKELADGQSQLEEKINQAQNAVSEMENVNRTIDALTGELSLRQEQAKQLEENEKTLRGQKTALQQEQSKIEQAITALTQPTERNLPQNLTKTTLPPEDAGQTLSFLIQKKTELEKQAALLQEKEDQLQETKKELQQGIDQLNQGIEEAAKGLEQIQAASRALGILRQKKDELEKQQQELSEKEEQLRQTKQTLDQAEKQLAEGEEQLKNAEEELRVKKAETEQAFQEAEKELSEAQEELNQARQEIDSLSAPQSYTLNRNSNVGYLCFENDSAIVDGLAEIFPLFFFLVAAMMCMTTMVRMIDEQRTEIGVLKALGYSRASILFKYTFYSGSAAVIGSAAGFFAGSYLFPKTIWAAYGILYGFAPVQLIFHPLIAAGTLAVSLLCTMGTTLLVCREEMKACAAQIMRPKAPKNGKRIFFERFRIFTRLKFLQKVCLRNIARYKQRLFMMILGVGGCTALLITGFGIQDSIQKLADYQYGQIFLYDCSVSFSDDFSPQEQADFAASLSDSDDFLFLNETTCDILTPKGTKSAYVTAPAAEGIEHFIRFESNGESVPFPTQGNAVVTKKFAETNGISVGSEITVKTKENRDVSLTVSGICDNYVSHYVYTPLASLTENREIKMTTALVKTEEGADAHQKAAKMAENSAVMNVTVNQDMRQRIDNMLTCVDYIVLLLIFSAGALAFVVIYNLTNINITERIREIATIKVLGFYPKETAGYVFGENLLLTAGGALLGLGLGKLLHAFVLSKINIDMISFNVRISPASFLISVLLTFVFSAAVDFFMYFKLQKINMAQSLKSIE